MLEVAGRSPLAQGFYTVAEAAKLIEVGSQNRIRNWLKGYAAREVGPLITRDFKPIDQIQELSFLDLLEVRFVEFFREQNVKIPTLRRALITARNVFGHEKPFALNHQYHVIDGGRDILVDEVLKPSAQKEGDRRLWSLVTRQHEMADVIIEAIQRGVTFDPQTRLAQTWRPRSEFPGVLIDPRIAYGQPFVEPGIPTEILFSSWSAEDEDTQAVAEWFEADIEDVEEAIAFEKALREPEPVLSS